MTDFKKPGQTGEAGHRGEDTQTQHGGKGGRGGAGGQGDPRGAGGKGGEGGAGGIGLSRHPMSIARKVLLTVYVLAVGFLMFGLATVILDNRNNVEKLQEQDVKHCVQVYNGIERVFSPFLNPVPSAAERVRYKQFTDILDSERRKCQTIHRGG